MNIYPTTSLSKPTGAEPVPKGTFGYLRARNRHRIATLIIKEFKESGLSQVDLARRARKSPATICRWLATPGNMRADSLSDLLFAISGAVPTYGVDYPLEQPARNDTRPDWLIERQADKKSVDTSKSTAQREASSAAEANEKNTRHPPINPNISTRLGSPFPSATHQQERTITPPKSLLELGV